MNNKVKKDASGVIRKITEKGGKRGLVPSTTEGRHDTAYNEYLAGLNPRENKAVQQALASSTDPRFVAFFGRLEAKVFGKNMSLATIAKSVGIGLEEFNAWWQKASTQRAIAIAQLRSVDVIEDMAVDARSIWSNCPRCDGLGFVNAEEGLPMDTPGYRILRFVTVRTTNEDGQVEEKEQPVYIRSCPNICDKGRIRKTGDEFSREKILEASNIINKKGPSFQLVQNFSGQSMPSAVPRLSAMTMDASFSEEE